MIVRDKCAIGETKKDRAVSKDLMNVVKTG